MTKFDSLGDEPLTAGLPRASGGTADALASGASVRKGVGVQIPPRARESSPAADRHRPWCRSAGVGSAWHHGGVYPPLSIAILAVTAVLILAAAALSLGNRPTGRVIWGMAASLEVLLAVQAVVGCVLLARTDRAVDGWVFVGYLGGSLVVLPLSAAWAKIEPGRWGPAIMGLAGLVIAVVLARLGQIWAGA